jgi:hypothetical protein
MADIREETVCVGCRLPNGLKLEVGFSVNNKGVGGAPFAMVVKSDSYRSFTLKGTNQHMLIRNAENKVVAQTPRHLNAEPYINRNVPKGVWDRWVQENPKSYHLRTKQIFLVSKVDPTTIRAASLDASAVTSNLIEPIDKSKKVKIGDAEMSARVDED